ncbi:MAG: hypothetical protein ACRDJL_03205 [Actinomycetota bacterium]
MEIVAVLVGGGLRGAVGPDAALGLAGIVGHHRAVGEVLRQRRESGGTHWGRDQQQDRLAARFVPPNVIGQSGAGHL